MSLNTLRKLRQMQNDSSTPELPNKVEEEEEEEEDLDSGDEKLIVTAKNRFDLLLQESHSESEVKEDDDLTEFVETGPNTSAKSPAGHHIGGAKKKKKRKKKKSYSKLPASSEDQMDNELDEIDLSLREVNAILGDAPVQNDRPRGAETRVTKNLLSVEYKYLNTQNEMKRIFGARVVQANENSRRRERGTGGSSRISKGTWIIQNQPNLAQRPKPGISMVLVDSNPEFQTFKFQHNQTYQEAQFRFYDAVESLNPENILSLLNSEPYHIHTLLQVSEIFRLADDYAVAAQLIERAIYVLEISFHPLFNVSSGNCRLQYQQQENRCLFIAIFRHILNVGQKGCYRTALELCKLLLSLSPEDDPLAVSLMLDFYALRAQEYSWLVALYDMYEPTKNLSMLPNYSFSVPLALFHLSEGTYRFTHSKDKRRSNSLSEILGTEIDMRNRADKMLQRALIMFPGLLIPLLDKCGVQPDPVVEKSDFMGLSAQLEMNKGLSQIVNLYIGRNYHVWKEADVMQWLESQVQVVLLRVSQQDPLVADCTERRRRRYQGTPTAIYRHIIIAEIKDATAALPTSLANSPVMSYDPLPPPNTICDYSRPSPKTSSPLSSSSIINSFFRSLRPTYDPNAEGQEDNDDEEELEGAAAATTTTTGELRASVNTILEAMRDLLLNLHGPNAPAEDADHSDDGGEEEGEGDHNQDWS